MPGKLQSFLSFPTQPEVVRVFLIYHPDQCNGNLAGCECKINPVNICQKEHAVLLSDLLCLLCILLAFTLDTRNNRQNIFFIAPLRYFCGGHFEKHLNFYYCPQKPSFQENEGNLLRTCKKHWRFFWNGARYVRYFFLHWGI